MFVAMRIGPVETFGATFFPMNSPSSEPSVSSKKMCVFLDAAPLI
jgi:hypothetical protein